MFAPEAWSARARGLRRGVVRHGAPVVVLACWAMVVTWPLVRYLASRVPVDLGDPLENVWIFGWDAHAFAHQPRALFNANIFFPARGSLAFAENMLGLAAPVAPLFWLTGNAILTTNAGILLVVFAGGASVYLLLVLVTGSRTAALVAALLFMAAPSRITGVVHVHVLAVHSIPLVVAALYWLTRRVTPGRAVLVGVVVAVAIWSSLTVTVLTFAAVGVWFVWSGVTLRRAALRPVAAAIAGLTLGVAAGVPVLAAYSRAQSDHPEYLHAKIEVVVNSATLGSYAFGGTGAEFSRDIYTDLAESFLPATAAGEKLLFPGIVASIAFVLGVPVLVVAMFRRPRLRAPALLFFALGLAGFTASLGPRWGAKPNGAPLPFAAVHRLVPGGLVRVPARFGTLVLLGVVLLVGVAVASLPVRARRITAVLLVAGLAVEAWPSTITMLKPPAITTAHRAIARRSGAVLALPTAEYTDDGVLRNETVPREAYHLYLSTAHFHPLTNGYGAFLPTTYVDIVKGVQQFPSATAFALLDRLGVKTVVVETLLVPGTRWEGVGARLAAWPGVRLIAASRSTEVYDVSGAATSS